MRRFLPILLVLLLSIQSAWIGAVTGVPHAAIPAPAQFADEVSPGPDAPAALSLELLQGERPCGTCHLPLPAARHGTEIPARLPVIRNAARHRCTRLLPATRTGLTSRSGARAPDRSLPAIRYPRVSASRVTASASLPAMHEALIGRPARRAVAQGVLMRVRHASFHFSGARPS